MIDCPLCGRPIGKVSSSHHLIPRSRKGKEQVELHPICHDKIHSVFTEKELAEYYNSVERLLESEAIRKFVAWVAKKPSDFYERTKDETNRKRKRGRR